MAKLLTAATPISYYLVVVNIVAFIYMERIKRKQCIISGVSKRQC